MDLVDRAVPGRPSPCPGRRVLPASVVGVGRWDFVGFRHSFNEDEIP